jgi:hypothetical protein
MEYAALAYGIPAGRHDVLEKARSLPAIGFAFRRGGRASSLGCRGMVYLFGTDPPANTCSVAMAGRFRVFFSSFLQV